MRGKDAIHVHCNSRVKIGDRFNDLPGYRTGWYEPTGIANILSMPRATKKFLVVFDSEGRNFSGWSSWTGKPGFSLSITGYITLMLRIDRVA